MLDLAFSILLAALPALLLLAWFRRQDRSRPEPLGLLGRSVLYGFLATVPAAALELLLLRVGPSGPRLLAAAFDAFVVAGFVEEGVKYFFVRRYILGRPEFDERMDGILYAACVSLGFAFAENILYGYTDRTVLLFRAFTAVPMHAAVSGIMGYWIGRAKIEGWGTGRGTELEYSSRPRALRGLWEAAIFHGAYDFFLFTRSGWALLAVVVLLAAGIRLVILVADAKRRDREDSP
ncbi:MAG: PrsW family intramembrane metalloprotease [Treponema sp.]|nr:PrsW family intramembrane metalloprotease [Treponema sp.]